MPIRSGFHTVERNQVIQAGYNVSVYCEVKLLMPLISIPLRRDFHILSAALRNMTKALKFSEDYANLLQNYISPEDYEEAMKELPELMAEYTREPREISDEEIAVEAKILLTALGKELVSDELAEMMNVDILRVEYALRKYSASKAKYE